LENGDRYLFNEQNIEKYNRVELYLTFRLCFSAPSFTNINFKLLEISTNIKLRISVGGKKLPKVLSIEEDVFIWLICMNHIYENSDLSSLSSDTFKEFINTFDTQEVRLYLQENENQLHSGYKVLGRVVKNFLPELNDIGD
jgi:hypothetical protein